jgi:branched-chain amino acid transport system substrate-binding protein
VDLLTGPCSSSVLLAISPLAKDHKVPLFSFAAKSHRATMDFGHPYIYQTQSNTMMDANAMAEYVAANGWQSVVTIGLDYEWGHQTVGQFVDRLKELAPGVQIKKQLWPKFGESNMNSFITATLSEKPDAVLAATFGPTSTSLIKQGNTYGMFERTNVVTIMPVEVLAALGKEMPNGIHGLGAAPFFALGTKSGEEFVQRFRARFNEYPKDYAVQSYDATKHFAEGMRRAGGTDPDKLRESMSSFTYNGIRGPLTFRQIDNQANAPGYVGVTQQSSDYPFPILANISVIPGTKTWGSEALVRELRAKATQ